MTNQYKLLSLLVWIALIPSCKKEEGRGGNSSIVGTVIKREYVGDQFFATLKDEHPAFGENVYIIYGDETSVGDNTDAGPDGFFEFKYLRKGHYKVFVISEDSSQAMPDFVPDTVFVKDIEITDKKQTVDAGTFIIYDFVN